MPEHTSFLTLLLAHAKETLAHNAGYLGKTFLKGEPPTWRSTEPIIAALIVAFALIVIPSDRPGRRCRRGICRSSAWT